MCDPAPTPVSQPTPAQQAKRPAALQFGPDPPPAKKHQADLNSHVVRTPAATKDDLDDQIAEFLYVVRTPAATKDDLDDQIAEFLYEVRTPAATKDDLDDQIAEFLYEVWTPAATKDDLDDQIAEFLYVVRTPAATKDDLDDQIAEFLYEVWTPAATIDDLDDQITEFLYGCSLPFSIVEHPLFKSLVSNLHPGYQPPSRQAVSNKLLDKCHDKNQAVMKQLLNNKTVTMQQDGWSSVLNDPVIATSVVSDGKGFFVDAKDTGTTYKTAQTCEAMFEDSQVSC